ncbi:methyltransferase domain-containing protein [bacterium]|nr:methyltransferase domain-containing protein [bacterium]
MTTSNDPYSQAVISGKYDRGNAFYAKYDHVRIFWEDAITRNHIKPFLASKLRESQGQGRGLRLLDLGCGSGDGFEMFLEIPADGRNLACDTNRLISYHDVDRYTGLDLNQDLLNQNASRWGNDPKMHFVQCDLSKGLPSLKDEEPYDIYFMGYGTLSHFQREETLNLLGDIVRHGRDGSIVLCDWLGRYSYEWQELWEENLADEQWMDYYISYIYPPEERDKVKLSPLPLRLVTQDEIQTHVLEKVKQASSGTLNTLGFYDRSIFIGRHMDTGDYNKHLTKPVRQIVNSLFERSQRTDLRELLLDYHPHTSNEAENAFFRQAFDAWNYVITQCASLLYGDAGSIEYSGGPPAACAVETVNTFKTMLDHLECYHTDDIRADVLEMQLGFLLRDLEASLQQGHGNGHGLIGIFEIKK